MASVTSDKSIQTGAWYVAKDLLAIRKIFGYRAAEYLRIPRRAGLIIRQMNGTDQVQFQTLGDQSKAIGMHGKETDTPRWHSNWLRKVKDPCNYDDKEYQVKYSWEKRGKYRQSHASPGLNQYFQPEFAGKVVVASHESFSGRSLWVRDQKGTMACIPKEYLNRLDYAERIADKMDSEVAMKKFHENLNKDRLIKMTFDQKYKIDKKLHNCVTINNEVQRDNVLRQELIDIGVFPAPKEPKAWTKGTLTLEEEIDDTKNMKENTMAGNQMNKVNLIDEKVRLMESRLQELEGDGIEEEGDLENDLDHSMVLDLPPNIAEWAKEAGVGLEDMIPLAKEICELQSQMTTEVQQVLNHTSREEVKQVQETERAEANATLRESVSEYRHDTMQTLIRWVAGASTISYLAHQASGFFI